MHKTLQASFKKSGLSIKALSERSGVPYAAVYRAVKGMSDPALSTVQRLSNVLGLELIPKRKGG
jgi:predicted transcriptional regulator